MYISIHIYVRVSPVTHAPGRLRVVPFCCSFLHHCTRKKNIHTYLQCSSKALNDLSAVANSSRWRGSVASSTHTGRVWTRSLAADTRASSPLISASESPPLASSPPASSPIRTGRFGRWHLRGGHPKLRVETAEAARAAGHPSRGANAASCHPSPTITVAIITHPHIRRRGLRTAIRCGPVKLGLVHRSTNAMVNVRTQFFAIIFFSITSVSNA